MAKAKLTETPSTNGTIRRIQDDAAYTEAVTRLSGLKKRQAQIDADLEAMPARFEEAVAAATEAAVRGDDFDLAEPAAEEARLKANRRVVEAAIRVAEKIVEDTRAQAELAVRKSAVAARKPILDRVAAALEGLKAAVQEQLDFDEKLRQQYGVDAFGPPLTCALFDGRNYVAPDQFGRAFIGARLPALIDAWLAEYARSGFLVEPVTTPSIIPDRLGPGESETVSPSRSTVPVNSNWI